EYDAEAARRSAARFHFAGSDGGDGDHCDFDDDRHGEVRADGGASARGDVAIGPEGAATIRSGLHARQGMRTDFAGRVGEQQLFADSAEGSDDRGGGLGDEVRRYRAESGAELLWD